MSYFKKFSDLMSAFGAFCCAVFIIGKYMSFDFSKTDAGGLADKLELFLDSSKANEVKGAIVLLFLFVIALLIGRAFEKVPVMSLLFSVFPILQSTNMLMAGNFDKNSVLYLFVALLNLAASIYDTILMDRRDGKKRCFWAAEGIGAVCSALLLFVLNTAKKYEYLRDKFYEGTLAESEEKIIDGFSAFGIDIVNELPEVQAEIIQGILIFVLICVLVGLVFRGAYFIDAALSAGVLFYSFWQWSAEGFAFAPAFAVAPLFVYFICRLSLLILPVANGKIK